MRNFALIATLAAATVLTTGCASRRAPDPQPTTPPTEAPVTPPQQQQSGPVPGSVEDFRVNVGDRVFFGLDRYDLTPEARQILERQAAWMRRYNTVRILISGNCDERGTREYNLALGARRANAARDYLISLGIEPSRIETVSYGKERPLDPRSSEEAWAVNRNAHSQIVSGAIS